MDNKRYKRKRKRKKIILISLILCMGTAACNLPDPAPQQSPPEIQTAAALTVQAVLTPLTSPTALATNSLLPTATQSAGPILTVPDNTNCRSGPGINYQIVTILGAGSSVLIVAQNTARTHWIVDPPTGTQNCWVGVEFGTVTGTTDVLPEVTPESESDSGAPARPGSLFYDYSCAGGQVTTTLSWSDAADNENGYRVYRFGAVIADLPPNSNGYVDEVSVAAGTQLQYSVEAYNDAGASQPRTAAFSC